MADSRWAGGDRDELREPLRNLARQAEQTASPGLADVRRRRARRQRNTLLAAGLAVVAVLGSTALFLNPFGDDLSIQPIGPGLTTTVQPSQSPSTGTSEPPAGSSSTTSASPAGSASTGGGEQSSPPAGDSTLSLDFASVVTEAELDAAGVAVGSGTELPGAGQPTIPGLCTGPPWQEQYSTPGDRIGGSYPLDGGRLVMDLFGYSDGVAANAALVKLKQDARDCPTVNEFLQITVTAVGSAIGDEFVVFALDSESGRDGSIERIWVTIARVSNVLVSATVDRDPGFTGDVSGDEALSRAAAQANVDHLLAG